MHHQDKIGLWWIEQGLRVAYEAKYYHTVKMILRHAKSLDHIDLDGTIFNLVSSKTKRLFAGTLYADFYNKKTIREDYLYGFYSEEDDSEEDD